MRKALRLNANRAAVARPEIVKAPTKGWSANSLAIEAEEGTAVILENFFPEATSIRPRKGFTEHATGVGSSVETLMSFVSGSTQKLFAAGNDAIYDVTSTGAVGAAVQSSLSSTKFSYVNFATAGGQFLFMVNGEDAARYVLCSHCIIMKICYSKTFMFNASILLKNKFPNLSPMS